MNSLSDFSLNCKGLTDPHRAIAVGNWLKDMKLNPHFICLQEIKCNGFLLDINLKKISAYHVWFSSNHPTGKGGTAIGISKDLAPAIGEVIHREHWISIKLKDPFNFTLLSIYAPCNCRDRALLWNDICCINEPVLISGDFNMVESSLDRYKGFGQVIKGAEKAAWDNATSLLDLSDVSGDTRFTWANGQVGECFRAARLDRVYVSSAVMNMFDVIDCHVDKSLLISDHYPVIFSARKVSGILKNGWFHADVSLLNLDVVQSKIRSILCQSFNFYRSPTKAWVLRL